MKFNFLFKTLILGIFIAFIASCDKDYNETGASLVNDDHYLFDKDISSTVIAYNQKVGPVATSNLPVNALGYYNSPVFGKTTASYVTQLELNNLDPIFKTHALIDSVHLYIPYFSTFLTKDATSGDSTYELDSLQGTNRINLKVFENGYFLRDYDASSTSSLTERQQYYSNQKPQFDAAIVNVTNPLYDSTPTITNPADFGFSPGEVKFTYPKNGETVVKARKTPGLSLLLDIPFFQNKIINAPAGKLINNNVFKDYFRGLYFQAAASATSPNQGTLNLLDFKQGKVTIYYRQDKINSVPIVADDLRERKTLILNISGNSVNLLENENNSQYEAAVAAANATTGDKKLYLKGQQGAISVISLFNPDVDVRGYDTNGNPTTGQNGVADELDDLRNKKWLVNEASLTFYIDKPTMANSPEPNRIMLYDLNNRRPIIDYYNDNSTSGVSAKYNKLVHGGIIEKENVVGGKGIKYKIRITNHIRGLLKNLDSTNVKLGLIVTENIGQTFTNQKLVTPLSAVLDRIPTVSVENPKGTVVYGTNYQPSDPDYDKRLKLEIYYTKPE